MGISQISSMLRISGISSGLDTESIITSLMSIERMKVDRVIQQQTRLEWMLEAHKSVNSQISAFRSANMSVLSDENLYTASAFNIFNVNMETQTSSVSISAGAAAAEGAVRIDAVTQIAAAAGCSSSSAITGGNAISLGTQLKDLDLAQQIVFGGVNGDELSFVINGETITVKNTDTMQALFNKINSSAANVRISYSELSNIITIQSKITGSASSLTLENTTGNLFGENSAFKIGAGTVQNGRDALLSINGYQVSKDSNHFTIDGISYSLLQESAAAIDFTVSRDIDATVGKIKSFVAQYNTLAGSLQSIISEERDYDYNPLTEMEKDEMTEDEIAKWEAKAKSGLLRNDRNLRGLLGRMRNMLYDTVEGTSLNLSSIGLRTGAYYDHGKITLDETALRDALADNPDLVTRLFTQSSESDDASVKYSESGFLPRLAEAFSQYTGTWSLSDAREAIDKIKQKVDDMNDLLEVKERQFWQRYAAMEEALSTMNAQSSWLSQQISLDRS